MAAWHRETDMNEDDLSREQRRHVEALHTEFTQQLARVNVNLRAASPHMNEIAPTVREALLADDSSEAFSMTFTLDVSGIVDTLRQLPDNAGTSQFIAAYNAGHPDWRDRPFNTR
jgi:hypothetical protein